MFSRIVGLTYVFPIQPYESLSFIALVGKIRAEAVSLEFCDLLLRDQLRKDIFLMICWHRLGFDPIFLIIERLIGLLLQLSYVLLVEDLGHVSRRVVHRGDQ